VQQAVDVGIAHLEILLLPHDQSDDIQRRIKKISEPVQKCDLTAEIWSSSILNVCAKVILFSNT
jgi:hypothetical protein